MLRRLLNDKRERVEFADLVTKYDRRGKVRLASPFCLQLLHIHDVSIIRAQIKFTVINLRLAVFAIIRMNDSIAIFTVRR